MAKRESYKATSDVPNSRGKIWRPIYRALPMLTKHAPWLVRKIHGIALQLYNQVPDPAISEDIVYQIRLVVSERRQSWFRTAIQELHQRVVTAQSFNPYNYDRKLYEELSTVESFMNGDPNWRKIDLSANLKNVQYLYRLDNLESLLRNTGNKYNETSGFGLMTGVAKRICQYFDNIITDSAHQRGEWLPLPRLLTRYQPRRNMSWWTDHIIDPKVPDGMLDTLYHLGIPNNWLREFSVIMRCDLNELRKLDSAQVIWVPSVIDGFCSPIFNPMDEQTNPTYGLGIYLRDVMQPGYREYVLRSLPLEALSFRVVEISQQQKEKHSFAWLDKQLYGQIINFHLSRTYANANLSGSY